MFKKMTGNDEIKTAVMDIQNTLPEMRTDIVESVSDKVAQIIGDDVVGYLKSHTLQIDRKFEEMYEFMSGDNIAKTIDKAEEKKEIEGNKQKIISNLSRVYAMEKESELLTKTKRGATKLTSEGQKVYDLFSQTVMDIAKLHGSKSHMKVANRTTYTEFKTLEKLSEELRKEPITLVDGTARESVYADIIKRRKLGKFAKFIEDKYVLNV